MKPIPIWGECALFSKKQNSIIIADVHIGIEFEYDLRGVHIDIQTDMLIRRCKTIIEQYSADTLVIVGDLRHTIVADIPMQHELLQQEHREVRRFLKSLSDCVDAIHIVKGNHDGALKSGYAKIYGARGITIEDIAFVHGHSWPDASLTQASLVVMGHIHPHIRLVSKIGYVHQYPCWLRGIFAPHALRGRYDDVRRSLPFIVIPAFNPLCGGAAVNREQFKEALFSVMDLSHTIAYTLEGVNLGMIRHLS